VQIMGSGCACPAPHLRLAPMYLLLQPQLSCLVSPRLAALAQEAA
jgi:hypothetical protein